MIRFYFIDPEGDLAEFTERVNLAESAVVLTTQAEQGSVGTSSLVVDDPLGDWDITGHRWVYVIEDTAPFDMVYWGYVADRKVTRMAPNVEMSRQWTVSVTDINTLLGRRVMVGSDCNRPAETDVERMQWLTGTTEQGFIDDLTYLDTNGPVDMDAVDYRYQYASQIYDDCAQASGKNYYLYPSFDGSDWVVGFWYGFGESTDFSSDIRISNDLDDIDDVVTFAPGLATSLGRDPSRVYSGVSMPYDGGTVYAEDSGTVADFGHRDTSAPMVNVKTSTKALARAGRYLNTIDTEEDVIETSLILPPSQVNDVMPGMQIEAKYVHLPGYADFSWMRVLARTVTFLTPSEYGVDLTLSAQPASVGPTPGPTVIGPFGIQYWVTRVTQNGVGDPGKAAELWLSLGGPTDPHLADDPNVGCTFSADSTAGDGTGVTESSSGQYAQMLMSLCSDVPVRVYVYAKNMSIFSTQYTDGQVVATYLAKDNLGAVITTIDIVGVAVSPGSCGVGSTLLIGAMDITSTTAGPCA